MGFSKISLAALDLASIHQTLGSRDERGFGFKSDGFSNLWWIWIW